MMNMNFFHYFLCLIGIHQCETTTKTILNKNGEYSTITQDICKHCGYMKFTTDIKI